MKQYIQNKVMFMPRAYRKAVAGFVMSMVYIALMISITTLTLHFVASQYDKQISMSYGGSR